MSIKAVDQLLRQCRPSQVTIMLCYVALFYLFIFFCVSVWRRGMFQGSLLGCVPELKIPPHPSPPLHVFPNWKDYYQAKKNLIFPPLPSPPPVKWISGTQHYSKEQLNTSSIWWLMMTITLQGFKTLSCHHRCNVIILISCQVSTITTS
ncbi:hypothetical protein Hanom_Chr12g01175311 [Helianthus anomalus]